MATLSDTVLFDVKTFLFGNMDSFRADAREYEELQLTIACNDAGDAWNYQTGDNSYTGGAYGLPHWAVVTIMPDSAAIDIYQEIIDQLEELI